VVSVGNEIIGRSFQPIKDSERLWKMLSMQKILESKETSQEDFAESFIYRLRLVCTEMPILHEFSYVTLLR
jgi:hypothetical protein